MRLIPFAYSASQTVVLEFGHQYVRFLVGGQALLESNKAVSGVAGNTLTIASHGYSAGDDLVVANRFVRVTNRGAVIDQVL